MTTSSFSDIEVAMSSLGRLPYRDVFFLDSLSGALTLSKVREFLRLSDTQGFIMDVVHKLGKPRPSSLELAGYLDDYSISQDLVAHPADEVLNSILIDFIAHVMTKIP